MTLLLPLLQVEFFDRHKAAELTDVLSAQLGHIETGVTGNVTRDRGLRSVCEVSLSLLLGPGTESPSLREKPGQGWGWGSVRGLLLVGFVHFRHLKAPEKGVGSESFLL